MTEPCSHCEHYTIASGQLFDTAIQLEETEDKLYRLRGRLTSATEAMVWLFAHATEPIPAWVRCALDEAEAPV